MIKPNKEHWDIILKKVMDSRTEKEKGIILQYHMDVILAMKTCVDVSEIVLNAIKKGDEN